MSAAYALAKPKMMANEVDKLLKSGFSIDELYKIVAPRRTLARRKAANEPLSTGEADRVFRLRSFSEDAERVFGDAEKSHRWMRKPCRALEGAVPIELLETEHGAFLLREELIRIRHGMFV